MAEGTFTQWTPEQKREATTKFIAAAVNAMDALTQEGLMIFATAEGAATLVEAAGEVVDQSPVGKISFLHGFVAGVGVSKIQQMAEAGLPVPGEVS